MRAPLTVIVVDDNATFRAAVVEMIEELPQFECVGEAASGEAAIELARADPPDLLLLDVRLPGLDGFATAAAIRAAAPATAVVLLTAAPDEGDAHRAGAIALLDKLAFGPVALARVAAELRRS